MFFNRIHWLKRKATPATSRRPAKSRRRPPLRVQLELLETRVVPAYDLTLGVGQTANVLHDAAGNFTAIGTGAFIGVADVQADLLAGKDVTIRNGSGGAETGAIAWQANSSLDYNGIGTGRQLTLTAGRTHPSF